MLVYAPGWSLATSWPPQEKVFIWPPFFEYDKRILRPKTGWTCLYMPQDGHWLASFEVIDPILFLKFLVFSVFAAKILSRLSRLSR